jgi:hypothetical protein
VAGGEVAGGATVVRHQVRERAVLQQLPRPQWL